MARSCNGATERGSWSFQPPRASPATVPCGCCVAAKCPVFVAVGTRCLLWCNSGVYIFWCREAKRLVSRSIVVPRPNLPQACPTPEFLTLNGLYKPESVSRLRCTSRSAIATAILTDCKVHRHCDAWIELSLAIPLESSKREELGGRGWVSCKGRTHGTLDRRHAMPLRPQGLSHSEAMRKEDIRFWN